MVGLLLWLGILFCLVWVFVFVLFVITVFRVDFACGFAYVCAVSLGFSIVLLCIAFALGVVMFCFTGCYLRLLFCVGNCVGLVSYLCWFNSTFL